MDQQDIEYDIETQILQQQRGSSVSGKMTFTETLGGVYKVTCPSCGITMGKHWYDEGSVMLRLGKTISECFYIKIKKLIEPSYGPICKNTRCEWNKVQGSKWLQ